MKIYTTSKYDSIYDKEKKQVTNFHRWKVEQSLGRKLLDDEVIHHKDRNKKNNDLSNLVVMKDRDHRKLHRKEFEQKRLALITKYKIVDVLPTEVNVGDVISLRPQRHRRYVGIECKSCGSVFWQRHDKQQNNCRKCVFVIETTKRWKDGVYDNRAKIAN